MPLHHKLRFVSPEYARLEQLVLALSHQLQTNQKEILRAMSQLQDNINQLIQDVAAENTVIDSAVTLLNGLAAQLDALVAQGSIDPQQVADISTTIKDKTNALANAVAADTRPATGATGTTGATGATGPSS